MPTPFKPDGYTSVAPYLLVNGADATIAFLRRVFDATPLRRHDEAGRIAHAEVRIDDTVLMLADRSPEWPAADSNVHIYVVDVDATYRRALDAGGVSVQEPVQKGDPDRRCGFKDAGGTTWWAATMVGECTPKGEPCRRKERRPPRDTRSWSGTGPSPPGRRMRRRPVTLDCGFTQL